jgi:hypothetical protein
MPFAAPANEGDATCRRQSGLIFTVWKVAGAGAAVNSQFLGNGRVVLDEVSGMAIWHGTA